MYLLITCQQRIVCCTIVSGLETARIDRRCKLKEDVIKAKGTTNKLQDRVKCRMEKEVSRARRAA